MKPWKKHIYAPGNAKTLCGIAENTNPPWPIQDGEGIGIARESVELHPAFPSGFCKTCLKARARAMSRGGTSGDKE